MARGVRLPCTTSHISKVLLNQIQTRLVVEMSSQPAIIIGLTGGAGHGKDTAASLLQHKYDFKGISIAEPLKKSTAAMFNVPLEFFYDRKLKEEDIPRYEMSPRRLMQVVGTDIVRNHLDKRFWIKMMGWKREDMLQEHREKNIDTPLNMVISDVRFDNEARAVKNLRGACSFIVKIDASERLGDNKNSISDSKAQGHITEQGVSKELIDYVVKNNGTKEELDEELRKRLWFLNSIKKE